MPGEGRARSTLGAPADCPCVPPPARTRSAPQRPCRPLAALERPFGQGSRHGVGAQIGPSGRGNWLQASSPQSRLSRIRTLGYRSSDRGGGSAISRERLTTFVPREGLPFGFSWREFEEMPFSHWSTPLPARRRHLDPSPERSGHRRQAWSKHSHGRGVH